MSPRQFGMRLKELREKRGLTQAELAKRANLSRAYLSRLEMGRHDPPLSRLQNLANALGVPVTTFVDASSACADQDVERVEHSQRGIAYASGA